MRVVSPTRESDPRELPLDRGEDIWSSVRHRARTELVGLARCPRSRVVVVDVIMPVPDMRDAL